MQIYIYIYMSNLDNRCYGNKEEIYLSYHAVLFMENPLAYRTHYSKQKILCAFCV